MSTQLFYLHSAQDELRRAERFSDIPVLREPALALAKFWIARARSLDAELAAIDKRALRAQP
jgi:hypothetical protein